MELSREQAKAFRALLAQSLGYFPASLAPEDITRYRDEIAQRKAYLERYGNSWGYRDGRWDHLCEEHRRREVEARGRTEVADLYDEDGVPRR